MWWNHDVGWAGWLMMTVGMVAFWALVALLVLSLVRDGRSAGPREPGPTEVLRRRLANGEIDVEEYQERLAALDRVER